jgi:arylesterase / paraoxonase
MATRIIFTLFLPLLLSVFLYSQSAPVSRVLLGRVSIDKTRLVRWENSTQLNNHDCRVLSEVSACEDVKIHARSGTAFLACGDSVERTRWYPCAGVRDAHLRSEDSFREKLFKYDLQSGVTTELKIRGLVGDFITHGIDVYELPDDPETVSRA